MFWLLIRSASLSWGTSNEQPQHMFSWRNKKNVSRIPLLSGVTVTHIWKSGSVNNLMSRDSVMSGLLHTWDCQTCQSLQWSTSLFGHLQQVKLIRTPSASETKSQISLYFCIATKYAANEYPQHLSVRLSDLSGPVVKAFLLEHIQQASSARHLYLSIQNCWR